MLFEIKDIIICMVYPKETWSDFIKLQKIYISILENGLPELHVLYNVRGHEGIEYFLREFFNGLDAKFYGNLLMKYETTLIINYV